MSVPVDILHRYARVDQFNEIITTLGFIYDISKNEQVAAVMTGLKEMVKNVLERNLDPDDELAIQIETNTKKFIAMYSQ